MLITTLAATTLTPIENSYLTFTGAQTIVGVHGAVVDISSLSPVPTLTIVFQTQDSKSQ